jgi:hypothetical protein
MLSRILGSTVVIFIVVWIVTDPASAGNAVHQWINDLIAFFRSI